MNILVCENDEIVAQEAADRFVCAAVTSVAERGEFFAAIPGGWSPRGMFGLLAENDRAHLVPWSRVHIFFTDERCVPPDSKDSNYRLAHDMLLSKVPIPDENVHRFLAELSPEEAAAHYADDLRKRVGAPPVLDLIVLGMGKDGHTASLFPNSEALNEDREPAIAHYVPKLDAHRLTLTLAVINNARSIVILAMGYEKADVLHQVLQGDTPPSTHPVKAVKPAHGRLLWLVSRDAASKLTAV